MTFCVVFRKSCLQAGHWKSLKISTTTAADLEPKALKGSMSLTPPTLIVAVETVGASGALAAVLVAVGFLAAEVLVCALKAGARSKVAKTARARSLAGVKRKR